MDFKTLLSLIFIFVLLYASQTYTIIYILLQRKQDKYQMEQSPKAKQQPQSDKVQVVLRIRPFLQIQEQQQFISLQNHHKNSTDNQFKNNTSLIKLNKPGNTSYMKFANVFTGQAKQQTFFKNFQETVKDFVQGVDGTIFAYGQTGAGKTYTMVGDCPQDNTNFMDNLYAVTNQSRGILPRAMDLILSEVQKLKKGRIMVSFYEIYNQKIYDLLSSNIKPLDLRQNKGGDISIPGLLSLEISNIKEGITCMAEGIKNRATSATKDNIKSSRSHSIFQIKYQRAYKENQIQKGQTFISTLRIVDLAGSQKFHVPYDLSQAQRQIRLQQLKSINSSLSKLGHCISALTDANRIHIPFRDSKLTRLLSQSLLGSGKVRVVVCVSPSMSAMYQTMSTLNFANHIKKAILNKPAPKIEEKKKMIQMEQYQKVLSQLNRERKIRQQLQRLLKTCQSGQETHLISSEQFNEANSLILQENKKLHQQVSELKAELAFYQQNQKQKKSLNRSIQLIKPLNLKGITKPQHHGTQISLHTRSLSPFESKSTALTPRRLNNNKKNQNSKQIVRKNKQTHNNSKTYYHEKSIENSMDLSISQFSTKQKYATNSSTIKSNFGSISYLSNRKQYIKNSNPFLQNKKEKSSFEQKMRIFVQGQNSTQVDIKIKQKLQQIKKQIIAEPLLNINDSTQEKKQYQKLWRD